MRSPIAPISISNLALSLIAIATLVHCSDDAENAGRAEGDAGTEAPPPRRDSSTEDDGGNTDLRTEAAGTRFRPLYVATAFDDGTTERVFSRSFLDMKLRIVCTVREIAGGAYACIPERWGKGAFSDEACSVPIAVITDLPRPEEQPYVDIGESCEPKIVKVEGQRRGETYRRGDDGTCFRSSSDEIVIPDPQIQPISMFGAFTHEEDTTPLPGERGGTRLALERSRFRGSDGSFQVDTPRIIDRERGSTGKVYRATDGKLRFFTAAQSVSLASFEFIDPTCTEAALEIAVGGGASSCRADPRAPKDPIMARASDDGCSTFALIKPITEAPLTTVYGFFDGACVEREPSRWSKVYRKTAIEELPPTALAEVTKKQVPAIGDRSVGGSKIEIRAISYTSLDGLELVDRQPTLHLRSLDVACNLVAIGDAGEVRCVPSVPWANSYRRYYADDACSQLLIDVSVDVCEPRPAFYRDAARQNRVYRRPDSPPLALESVYYRNERDQCVAQAASQGTDFYPDAANEEIPISEFPKMTKYVLQ